MNRKKKMKSKRKCFAIASQPLKLNSRQIERSELVKKGETDLILNS